MRHFLDQLSMHISKTLQQLMSMVRLSGSRIRKSSNPTNLTISPTSAILQISGTVQLVATILDSQNTALQLSPTGWWSSNPSVATVNITGIVTARSLSGSTNISASYSNSSVSLVSNLAVITLTNTTTLQLTGISAKSGTPIQLIPIVSSSADATVLLTTNAGLSGEGSLIPIGSATPITGILGSSNVGLVSITATTSGSNNNSGSDEPVFNATTNTMQFQENFDEIVSAHQMWLDRNNAGTRFSQPDPPPSSTGEDPSHDLLISPGYGGTGQAIRCAYDGTDQEGHGWWLRNMNSTPDLTTHVFQMQVRVILTVPLTNISDDGRDELPIKWIELNHFDGSRCQFNTHDYLPGSPTGRLSNCMFEVLDQNDTGAHQALGPTATTLFNSGQWHRYTYRYRCNSAQGARDGFAQMWVDGTKIIDISAATLDVTPTGGWKPWCNSSDLDDNIANNMGIVFLKMPSVLTYTTQGPFTIDWDDFKWWTEN